MTGFSKIQQAIQWCFVPKETDLKHSGLKHPVFSFLFGIGATLIPMVKISDYLEKKYPKLKGDLPPWASKKLPIGLAIYIFFTILSRVKISGNVAFYDFLWACNISILLMIVGLIKKRPLLISTSMILIAIDQVYFSY